MTIEEIKLNKNFLIGLRLPQLEVYLGWNGGANVEFYAFRNNAVLFHDHMKFSPLHAPDSLETICDLLGFLTCRPGDTDDTYFANYTEGQQLWCQSRDCEDVALLISDYEDRDSERHAVAKGELNEAIVTR